MNINCTGCGGVHPRPGGSMCKNLATSLRIHGIKEDMTGAMAADTSSKMAGTPRWSAILPPDELSNVPDRTSDEYLAFCEKVITEVTQKVEASEEEGKVLVAKKKITELMTQLQLNESSRERGQSHAGEAILPVSCLTPWSLRAQCSATNSVLLLTHRILKTISVSCGWKPI